MGSKRTSTPARWSQKKRMATPENTVAYLLATRGLREAAHAAHRAHHLHTPGTERHQHWSTVSTTLRAMVRA